MIELDALFAALWVVAPVYIAVRRAAPPMPHQPRSRPLPRPVLALLYLAVAIWLGTRRDLAVAVVTAIAAVTAVAGVMTLLVPAAPRLARLLAVLAPCIAALAMLCLGGCHGA